MKHGHKAAPPFSCMSDRYVRDGTPEPLLLRELIRGGIITRISRAVSLAHQLHVLDVVRHGVELPRT